jgi:tetratricopeptide (TPR) repeat protein
MLLAGPACLGYVLACAPAGAAPGPRSAAVAAALVLCGLGLYGYLPLRSLSDPAMDWGDPETPARIWDHVTLGQYRGVVSAPRSVARFLAQCWAFLRHLAGDFTPWLAWLPLAGVAVAATRRRQDEIFLLALLASVFLGATLVSNFDVGFHAIEANSHHWIPSHLFLAILAGVAIDAALRSLALGPVVAFAAAGAVAASPLIANFRRNDMSRYFLSRDYGRNLLKTMAANAIYFPEGDYTVFPILYLQVVEGHRQDVTLASRYAYLDEEIYELLGEEAPTSLSDARHWETTQHVIERLLESAPDRPVYAPVRHPVATARVVQDGLLYRYLRPRESWQPDAGIWEFYDWHTLAPDELRGNWTAELILQEYLRARAIWLLARNRAAEARPLVDEAHSLSHGDPDLIGLLGDVYAQAGLHDEALPFYREALARDPDRVDLLLALGRAALFADRPGLARKAARRLEALAPGRADVQHFRERVRDLPAAEAP